MKLRRLGAISLAAALMATSSAIVASAVEANLVSIAEAPEWIQDGKFFVIRFVTENEEKGVFDSANEQVLKIAGIRYTVKGESYATGAIVLNSASTGWKQTDIGKDNVTATWDGQDGVIEMKSDKALFAETDNYAQILLGVWNDISSVEKVEVLDAEGNAIWTLKLDGEAYVEEKQEEAAAEETTEEAAADEEAADAEADEEADAEADEEADADADEEADADADEEADADAEEEADADAEEEADADTEEEADADAEEEADVEADEEADADAEEVEEDADVEEEAEEEAEEEEATPGEFQAQFGAQFNSNVEEVGEWPDLSASDITFNYGEEATITIDLAAETSFGGNYAAINTSVPYVEGIDANITSFKLDGEEVEMGDAYLNEEGIDGGLRLTICNKWNDNIENQPVDLAELGEFQKIEVTFVVNEPAADTAETEEETEAAEADWSSYDADAMSAANEAFQFDGKQTIDLYAALGDDWASLATIDATFTWTAGTGWCGGAGIGNGAVFTDGSGWVSGAEFGAANANEGVVNDGEATQTIIDITENPLTQIASVGDDGVTTFGHLQIQQWWNCAEANAALTKLTFKDAEGNVLKEYEYAADEAEVEETVEEEAVEEEPVEEEAFEEVEETADAVEPADEVEEAAQDEEPDAVIDETDTNEDVVVDTGSDVSGAVVDETDSNKNPATGVADLVASIAAAAFAAGVAFVSKKRK